MRLLLVASGLIVLAALGCAEEPRLLLVDVRTDLVPGSEFTTAEVDLGGAAPIVTLVSPASNFVTGVRVAEVSEVPAGVVTLEVTLRNVEDVVLSRTVRVRVEGRTGITVVMTRDCRGVSCDDPSHPACLAGLCVSDECTEESPEACLDVAECTTDGDCDAPACVEARCAAGVCLSGVDESACSAEESCDPDLGCAAFSRGDAPQVDWGFAANGSGGELATGVATDAALNVYITGRIGSESNVDLGGGPVRMDLGVQAFVASYASDGTHRWSTIFGGAGGRENRAMEREGGAAITVDTAGDVYVAGSVVGDVDFGGGVEMGEALNDAFVASWDPEGMFRWAQRGAGVAGSAATSIDVDDAGVALIVGYFWGDLDMTSLSLTSLGSADVFAAGVDATGTQWALSYGGADDDRAAATRYDGSGGFWVAGSYEEDLDIGGTALTETSGAAGFMARMDATRATEWVLSVDALQLQDLAVDSSDGSGYAVGSFDGTLDLGADSLMALGGADGFVIGFDGSGVVGWAVGLRGPLDAIASAVALDSAGNVYVTGWFSQTVDLGGGPLISHGERDLFVASYTPEGVHRFSIALGGDEDAEGHGVAVDAAGAVYIVGRFRGDDVEFGSVLVGDSSSRQVLLLKLVQS